MSKALVGDTAILNRPLETTCCERPIPAGKVLVITGATMRKLVVMIKGEGAYHKVKRGDFNRAVAPL